VVGLHRRRSGSERNRRGSKRHRTLPDILTERGEDRLAPRCYELRVVRTPGGGFRLRSSDHDELVVGEPDGDRRTVKAGERSWALRRSTKRQGWVLEASAPPGKELARTDRDDGPGAAVSVYLDDGRVFWIVPHVDAEPRYELRGWEVDAAYWIARADGAEWSLAATPAGTGLQDSDPLVVLLAAEIIDLTGA